LFLEALNLGHSHPSGRCKKRLVHFQKRFIQGVFKLPTNFLPLHTKQDTKQEWVVCSFTTTFAPSTSKVKINGVSKLRDVWKTNCCTWHGHGGRPFLRERLLESFFGLQKDFNSISHDIIFKKLVAFQEIFTTT